MFEELDSLPNLLYILIRVRLESRMPLRKNLLTDPKGIDIFLLKRPEPFRQIPKGNILQLQGIQTQLRIDRSKFGARQTQKRCPWIIKPRRHRSVFKSVMIRSNICKLS